MEKKIAFVILHYLAIEETVNCIASIYQNINYSNYIVIVVDNGSGIKVDADRLRKLAETDDTIKFVELKQNLGFARGNNVGFEIAKKKYNADFIVLMNNDVLIEQSDFCNIICQKYNEYHYAVMGPKIYLTDGTYYSNPMKPGRYKVYTQRVAQFITILKFLGSFFDLDLKQEQASQNARKQEYEDYHNCDTLNYKLHGCCLIFSQEYIRKFDGLNPNTFLYLEEDILFLRIRNNGLKSLYSPCLWLIHLEDAATNKMIRSGRKKRRFIYRNHVLSYFALIREIKGSTLN